MNTKRILAGTFVGLGVATVGFASASVLNLDAGTIQHGSDSVTGQVGVANTNWGLETDDNTVRSVRFSDLEAEVVGDQMFVKVLDTSGALIQKGDFTITGTNADRLALPATTTADAIGSVEVWIEG